ncbi:MAG: oligosaccharide flippase family protein [Syntrophobacteraceae bacterium]|nr:oligosaccharide flippase family protein [Syntrophobacteraceae bacterium]MDR3561368.1 oligosaccharide flippase family protein [Negativicutes bacterium]
MRDKVGDTIWVLILNVLQVAVQGAIVIKLATLLGPTGFGFYCLAVATGTFGAFFGSGGGDQVLIMFGSRDDHLVSPLFGNALLIRVALSLLSMIGCLFVGVLYGLTRGDLIAFILIALAHVILGFVNPLFTSYYRVIGKVRIPWVVMFVFKCVFLIAILCWNSRLDTLLVVSYALLAVNVASLLFFIVDMTRTRRITFDFGLIKSKFRVSQFFWLSQLIDFAISRVDIFLIQAFLGYAAVGIYSLANRFVAVLITIPSAVAVVMLPEFHRCSDDREKRFRIFYDLRRLILEVGIYVLGVTYLCGGKLLILLSSKDYSQSLPIVGIICISTLVNFICYPYSMLLEAEGFVSERFWVRVYSLLVTIVLCLVFIHFFGIIGAAVGVLCGMISFWVFLHVVFLKPYEKWSHFLSEMKPFVAGGVATSACLLLSTYVPSLTLATNMNLHHSISRGDYIHIVFWICVEGILYTLTFAICGNYSSILKYARFDKMRVIISSTITSGRPNYSNAE